ncbi:MAG: ABC transporter ATP-binding protein [Phycisphaerae bacterium]|nr:ABC transporter ATP-binding protein [Tepidisphaeraceae bacterium]
MIPAVLELLNIRKTFPGGVVALDDTSVRLMPGTVHGVLGENGAGKSTLMNVAYGLLRPDAGEIRVGGAPASFRSPRDAIAAGVGMVHQHFALAPALTVLDNVILGDRRIGQVLPRRALAERLVELAESLNLTVDPQARVEALSVGQQQRVEILKALWRDARVLILDEPTAVLTPGEAEQLFAAVERLKADGRTVVFISHKLGEVARLCDHVTVLRRGRVVFDGSARGLSAAEIAGHMVGRTAVSTADVTDAGGDVAPGSVSVGQAGGGTESDAPDRAGTERTARTEPRPPVLVLEHLSAGPVRDLSLTLTPGTITGVAGVDGNGQQELAELIIGLRRPTAGRVLLHGADVTRLGAARRASMGLAHVPNDRKREALATGLSVAENVALKWRGTPLARAGVLSWRRVREAARALVGRFDVRTSSERAAVGTLSGGNQQKVVLARELALPALLGRPAPRLIVAMNPVRGLDLNATRFVYERLREARDAGAAVLLIGSELDELIAHCDRIAVLYSGRLTMTTFPETSRDEIGRMMAGVETR